MSAIKSFAQKLLAPYLYGSAYSRARATVIGLAWRECCSAFPQFLTWRDPLSPFRALKYMFYALMRLVFGRSLRYSYAYKAEDRQIESLLKPIITQKGYYVEVGCNEPIFASNTFLLYRRGWRGITIDPNERLIRKHKRIRPRDLALCAFVSDREEEVEYVNFSNEGLSTADAVHKQTALDMGHHITYQKKIKTQSLTQLLEHSKAPAQFDLLSVDAEGKDLEVLRSLDWSRYSPRLVVVEADDFNPMKPGEHPVCRYMLNQGYFLHGSLLTNLYFLKGVEKIFS